MALTHQAEAQQILCHDDEKHIGLLSGILVDDMTFS
jgi:hypothetical protein